MEKLEQTRELIAQAEQAQRKQRYQHQTYIESDYYPILKIFVDLKMIAITDQCFEDAANARDMEKMLMDCFMQDDPVTFVKLLQPREKEDLFTDARQKAHSMFIYIQRRKKLQRILP